MAFLSSIIRFTSEHILGLVIAGIVFYLSRNYFTPGVVSIPGPFAAKLSNIWRFIDVARGRPDITLYNLHKKYGDYVRLGPNVVSVRNLDVLKTIYGINKGFRKVGNLIRSVILQANLPDELLSCPTAACKWKTDTDAFHYAGRRFPRGDQASSNISLFDEHINRF